MLLAAVASVEPIRSAVANGIITWYEEHIEVRYGEEDTETVYEEFELMRPTYLPDGWNYEYSHKREDAYLLEMKNSNGGVLHFCQSLELDDEVLLENDIVNISMLYLKENTVAANLFEYGEGECILVWRDEYIFLLESKNVELSELIKVAESVK